MPGLDLTDLELPEPPVVEGELVERPAQAIAKTQARRLRSLEDDLLLEATETIQGAGHFYKISEEDIKSDTPPAAWVNELGEERARERFRLAKYALMSAKDAPVGLKMALQVHSSIVKARATEKAGSRVMNVQLVRMPEAIVEYPELEVGERK